MCIVLIERRDLLGFSLLHFIILGEVCCLIFSVRSIIESTKTPDLLWKKKERKNHKRLSFMSLIYITKSAVFNLAKYFDPLAVI